MQHQSSNIFAKRLRRLRQQRGWTQSDLARESGVSQQSISSYEKGRDKPGSEHAAALAAALGVSTDHLLAIVSEAQEPKTGNWILDLDVYRANEERLASRSGELLIGEAFEFPAHFRILSPREFARLMQDRNQRLSAMHRKKKPPYEAIPPVTDPDRPDVPDEDG